MTPADGDVYRKYADELIRFATTLVGPSAAEDVFSSAMIRAMRAAAWADLDDPRPYLYRSVANAAIDLSRRDRRRIWREQRSAVPEVVPSDELASDVIDAMRGLTIRQRSITHLAFWHDMTVREISETMRLSVRTTERELSTAKRRLQEMLR